MAYPFSTGRKYNYYIMYGCMASCEHIKDIVSCEFEALNEQLAIYPAL